MNGKRLIYIIGAGRSGTTVLDIVLGNASGATSLGEVNRFFRRGGIPPARKTAEPTALFWDRFRKDFEDSDPEFSDYPTLQNLMHANEYHTAFFRWLFKKQDAKYARVIRTFYKLLEAQTPGEILIESSKYPMRAMHISRILKDGPFEIAYIYLKRDPVKVVRSFRKKGLEQPPKGFLTSNLYYLVVNALCALAVSRLERRGHLVSRITFEELTETPVKTLERVQRELKVDVSQAIYRISRQADLDMGMLFDGNRIRLKDSIRLKTGESGKLEMNLEAYFTRAFNYLIYR